MKPHLLTSALIVIGLLVGTSSPTLAASVRTPVVSTPKLTKPLTRSYLPLSPHTTLLLDNKMDRKILVKDYLASTRSVLDRTGQAISATSYFPYGTSRTASTRSTGP